MSMNVKCLILGDLCFYGNATGLYDVMLTKRHNKCPSPYRTHRIKFGHCFFFKSFLAAVYCCYQK